MDVCARAGNVFRRRAEDLAWNCRHIVAANNGGDIER